MLGKLLVRKFEPGIGSARSLTVPTVLGRDHFCPPSREIVTTCALPCSNATYTLPSGPVVTIEPWRPLPVPLLPAGESCFDAPKLLPPSVEIEIATGSEPLPAERN